MNDIFADTPECFSEMTDGAESIDAETVLYNDNNDPTSISLKEFIVSGNKCGAKWLISSECTFLYAFL